MNISLWRRFLLGLDRGKKSNDKDNRAPRRRRRPIRLHCEELEPRQLLSGTGAAPQADLFAVFSTVMHSAALAEAIAPNMNVILANPPALDFVQGLLRQDARALGQAARAIQASEQQLTVGDPFQAIWQVLGSFVTAFENQDTFVGQILQVDLAPDFAGQTPPGQQTALSPFPLPESPPTPTVTINGAPASSPEGTAISLTSTVTEANQTNFTYAWNVTENGTSSATGNQANFSFTPNDAGSYVVNLTATDPNGNKGTATATISVTDVSPTLSITGVPSQITLGTAISAGSSVTEASSTEQQAGFTYSWNVTQSGSSTSLASGNQASFNYTPTASGTYVVSLAVTDIDGTVVNAQQTVSVSAQSSPSNLILLPSTELASLQQQAANNTPQWQAFKARLDAELPIVVGSGQGIDQGAYQGSELTWIADYALGYLILKDSDPATAANYAGKAIGLIKSALNDYQKGQETSLQYLTRGDGSTTTFTLPNSDIIPSSLVVYEAPVQIVSVVRGTTNLDTIDNYQKILKISNTSDGNPDYVEGTDWVHDGSIGNDQIEWLPNGKQPAAGATYYVTETSSFNANSVSSTLNGDTITLATAPPTGQAVFVQYLYNTSTLKYQQTSAGDGGFNSIYIDDNYSARFLGPNVALGVNWLQGYPGLSQTIQDQAVNLLTQWFNYLPGNAYYFGGPGPWGGPVYSVESNMGIGSYESQVYTALALQGLNAPGASQMMSDVLSWRQKYVLPALQDQTSSLNGGYWAEGWNYGRFSGDLLLADLALEQAGQITATPERQWASQAIEELLEGSPTEQASPATATEYDGGEWYRWPTPFPNVTTGLDDQLNQVSTGFTNDFLNVLSAMASDPNEQAYANFVIQNSPDANSNDAWDLLLRNPTAPASNWTSSLPLQYLAQGAGLLTARSDWGNAETWVSLQMGNLINSDHQSNMAGQLQIQRGADDLLINAPSAGFNQDIAKSRYGNLVVVDSNGDQNLQRYPFSEGIAYGTPGVVVTSYEANNNYVYMAGNYAAAYSPDSNPGSGGPVSALTREMVYLRPDYVVVYDRVKTLQAAYYKSQQWNFLNAPTVNGNSFVETVGNSTLFGQDYSTTPITTKVKSVTLGPRTIQEVENQPNSPTASVNFVTAFQAAPSTTTTMDATEHVVTTDGRMEGTQIGNQLVLFGFAAGTVDLTTGVTYSLSGSGPVSNMLVDLQAGGTYQVQADGTSLGNVTASSQGTITFTTPAGAKQVTVTRQAT